MSGRKRICAFMGELSLNFQRQVCDVINKLSRERDIETVLYASYGSYIGPYGRNPFFELGEKNVIYLPDFSTFDGVLVFPDTFDVIGMDQELYTLLKKEATCPVISIRNGSPDFPIVTVNNQVIFRDITNHFIKDHNFKNICFMSGPLDLKDGLARYEGYVNAMKDAGLEIKRNFFFEGNYWRNLGAQAVDRFLKCPEEDFPEAIVCANDYMALSVVEELINRGIKVPEQVCVSGFDNIEDCTLTSPTLTTVEIVPDSFVIAAFDAMKRAWDGERVPKKIYVDYEMKYRQSCGCGNEEAVLNISTINNKLIHFDNIIRDNSRMVAEYQNSFAFDNTMVVAAHYFGIFECKKGYLCLCDEDDPEYKSVEMNKVYSDDVILKRIMFRDRKVAPIICDEKFPRNQIIPEQYSESEGAGLIIIYTIHFRSKAYGYIAIIPEIGEVPDLFTNIYLNSLASALESGYVEAQFLEMAEIQKQYLLDPLTGVYNRRGFEKRMQSIVNQVNVKATDFISICSVDMDNLKLVNDQFGHAEGDYAILSLVKAINLCIEEGDFVARMGGDEFIVVLVGDTMDRQLNFKERMKKTLARISVESVKPYSIHASVGISGPERIGTLNLYESLQNADEKMYENKKKYKNSLVQ